MTVTDDIPPAICMGCGKDLGPFTNGLFDEHERDAYTTPPGGFEAWIYWVYCGPCDTWTEHPYLLRKDGAA